jgi:uncharacterized protein YecT (DUF1311 family)
MRKSVSDGRAAGATPLVAIGVLLFVVLSPTVSRAGDDPPKTCNPVPDTWGPSLDEVRNYLEEKSNAATQAPQRQLTRTSQLLADLSDAQLFIVYVRLMQKLDATGQEKLFEEQSRWLGKRTEQARSSVTSKGGTLGALEYSSALGKITGERLAELQRRLRQQGTATQERKEAEKP